MAQETVIDVSTLNPQEQAAVREFIAFLKQRRESRQSPFLAAVDEFIAQHPDLLQRLAQ